MTLTNKNRDSGVTLEMIRRVHLTLADLKTGEDILNFLRSTEPVFMDEVSRFISTEVSRMKYQLSDAQSVYVASVVGASYIAGFLIAREAAHKIFDDKMGFKSDIKQALTPAQIENVIDKKLDEGKSYKEISKVIRLMLDKDTRVKMPKPAIEKPRRRMGKKIDLGDLD